MRSQKRYYVVDAGTHLVTKETDDIDIAMQEKRHQCSGNRRQHFIVDLFEDAREIDYSEDRLRFVGAR